MNIKIVSLNCYGPPISFNRKTRFHLIAEQINKTQPDLVLLQEVIFQSDLAILKNILEPLGWNLYFKNNGLMVSGGLVTITKNIKLVGTTFHKFSKQGGLFNYLLGCAILGKGLQISKFKEGNNEFCLVNTHFLYMYSHKGIYANSQNQQINEVVNAIKLACIKNVILGGDFNIELPDSDEIKHIKESIGLSDVFSKYEYTLDPNNLNRKGKIISILSDGKPCRPDYIFLNPDIKVIKHKVIFSDPILIDRKKFHTSDHFGLYVEIVI